MRMKRWEEKTAALGNVLLSLAQERLRLPYAMTNVLQPWIDRVTAAMVCV